MPFLHYPWSLILALVFVYLMIVIYTMRDRWSLYARLSSQVASISSIAILLVLLIVFGAFPQYGMNHSFVFLVASLFFTTVIVLRTIENLANFSRKRLGVTLSHLAISIVMIAGLCGSGDMRHVEVRCEEGVPVRAGVEKDHGNLVMLPFEICLNKFSAGGTDRPYYLSEVIFTKPDGTTSEAVVRVNHPARLGSWRIYQQNYGLSEDGKDVSILQCVKDPWQTVISIALWMLLLSAFALIFFAGLKPALKKKEVRS